MLTCRRKTGHRRCRTNALSALLLMVTMSLTVPVSAAPSVPADDSTMWIIQPGVTLKQGGKGVRLIRAAVTRGFVPPLRIHLRRGSVERAAVVSGQLHAFFSDGTYYRFSARQAIQERKLPGGALPLALTGNPADRSLLVVLPARTVGRILEENARLERIRSDEEEPTTQPERETDRFDDASASYWLVRYARRRWEPVEPMPEFLGEPISAWMALSDTTLALAWRDRRSGTGEELQYAQRVSGQWIGPETVPQTQDLAGPCLGLLDDQAVLVGMIPRPSDPVRVGPAVFRRRPEAWDKAEPLDADGTPLSLPGEGSAATLCAGKVGVLAIENTESVHWGLWPIEGGAPVQDFKQVPGLAPPPERIFGGRWSQFAAYFCLFSLLMAVFWRRQSSLLEPAQLPPGVAPVAYGRRALGFALDMMPAVAATMPFWAQPLNAFAMAYGQHPDDPEFVQPFFEGLWAPWLLTRFVYTGYCSAWELWRGNTPGKMAMRCAVCSVDGRPCGRRQIISRNLLRMIELEPLLLIWPLFLLLVITRNRQRLGDVWARTVVVQRVPIPPEPREREEDEP